MRARFNRSRPYSTFPAKKAGLALPNKSAV